MGKINCTREYVFYTIQGEGKYCGYPTVFVRLSGCNLRCAWKNMDGTITKCDTPHSSFSPEKNIVEISQIIKDVAQYNCTHVVVTGGEPYLQKHLQTLVDGLALIGHYVTIETNGTIYEENQGQFLSISPKLSNSAFDPIHGSRHENKRLNYEVLDKMMRNHDYQLKFVVNNEEDLKEIKSIARVLSSKYGHSNIDDHIWLMPQGIETEQISSKREWLFEVCKENHWKFTDRLHIKSMEIEREFNMDKKEIHEKVLKTPWKANGLTNEQKRRRLQQLFKDALETIGMDLNDDSLQETPKRMAKMWVNEIFSGLDPENFPKITTVKNKMKYDGAVILTNIELNSNCEHHLVPFIGRAHIAYLPKVDGNVIGLSKIPRIAQYYAKRPQIQERLAMQILECLQLIMDTKDVAVVIDAVHMCVKTRGVEDSAATRTPILGGQFKEDGPLRQEFYSSIPKASEVNLI